jgi:CBS domain-containing protein
MLRVIRHELASRASRERKEGWRGTTMKIGDFMTQGVYTVRREDNLELAAQQMWEHDCGALPVIDRGGRVVAMITDRDVCMAGYTQGKPLAAIRVSTAMSKSLVSCGPDDTMSSAERVMRQHQVRRLPVVDDDGRLVGIVSLNDLAIEAVSQRKQSDGELTVNEMATTLAEICRHHHTAIAVRNE